MQMAEDQVDEAAAASKRIDALLASSRAEFKCAPAPRRDDAMRPTLHYDSPARPSAGGRYDRDGLAALPAVSSRPAVEDDDLERELDAIERRVAANPSDPTFEAQLDRLVALLRK